MDTPLVATRTWSVKSLGALRLWTIVGLLGSIAMLLSIQAASIYSSVAAACVLGLLLTMRDFFAVDHQVADRVP